jgi:hypothetical protein
MLSAGMLCAVARAAYILGVVGVVLIVAILSSIIKRE